MAAAKPEAAARNQPALSTPRRRKFPYRKAMHIEAEIQQREVRLAELHNLLASPDVLRDGKRVKELSAELDEQQAALPQLYEHWEEAAELNG
jgi:hypothetical protein